MADPVRARRLTDQEGQRLTQIVRRGRGNSIRVRRATIILASASGTPVPAIARLVAADEDTVRDVIHAFNERGLAALDPQWAGGRPRLISDDDVAFIVTTATTRPEHAGPPVHPLERAQTRRLPAPATRPAGRGSAANGCGRSCASTRSASSAPGPGRSPRDPDKDAKLDRIEYVTSHFPDRCFAFDQFGPLSIRPCHGSTLGAASPSRSGCPRPTTARTASATSTAATASATTSSGASTAAARAATTPWPRSSRSGPPARTAHRST